MSSSVTTARTVDATVEPVTLQDAKQHLQVTTNDDDQYISDLISVARRQVEAETDRALITQTWQQTRDAWPVGSTPIELWPCPVASVSQITYVDGDGATQTLATSVYELDANEEPGQIRLKYDQSWPALRGDDRGITITYVSGYGAAPANVEPLARHAVLYLLAWMYEMRTPAIIGTTAASLPFAYQSKINAIKFGMWP